jgi:glycerol-3-phosphate acyltransferase PlsY
MNALAVLGVISLGYLLGAIPVGVLASRWLAGVDPREGGSRNVGFTNVLRVAGTTAGVVTLFGDMGKGAAAVVAAQVILRSGLEDGVLAAGGAAILGHLFSIFLRFKGGKGVATALGVFFALDPILGGSLVLIWLSSAVLWRISSLAAIVAFGSLPVVTWIRYPRLNMLAFAVGVTALIAYRHAENIRRLLAGTEPKFSVRPNPG